MTSIVSHHTAGKSPPNQPVKANGSSLQPSPSAITRAVIAPGPPTAAMPTAEAATIAKTATIPWRKSPITTPQYPAASVYTAVIMVGTTRPTHNGHPNASSQTLPIAMPTQPRMNMFMNTCHPASHPLRSSAPIPPNRMICHSAWE
jgi:hypothetical protein